MSLDRQRAAPFTQRLQQGGVNVCAGVPLLAAPIASGDGAQYGHIERPKPSQMGPSSPIVLAWQLSACQGFRIV